MDISTLGRVRSQLRYSAKQPLLRVSGFAISERVRSVILAERAPFTEFRQILAHLNMLP